MHNHGQANHNLLNGIIKILHKMSFTQVVDRFTPHPANLAKTICTDNPAHGVAEDLVEDGVAFVTEEDKASVAKIASTLIIQIFGKIKCPWDNHQINIINKMNNKDNHSGNRCHNQTQ